MKPPTDAARSALMARVRQQGTGPERAVAILLRSLGLSYRKNVRGLPGSPDFANKRKRWAVFVHGCFWHGHKGCRFATIPKRNRDFWLEKFARNRARDAGAVRELRRRGFKVSIVWGCEVDEVGPRLSKVLEPRRIDMGRSVDH